MQIINEKPPNYDKIVAAFPAVADMPYVLFAYGSKIYNPSGKDIPSYKMAHEQVHGAQQLEVNDPEWWWDMYIQMKGFRLQEETPAYRIDYAAFCEEYHDRNERAKYLEVLASELSSELYGNIITKAEAKKLIKNAK